MHNVALLSHTTQRLISTTHPHLAFGIISDAKQLSASHYKMDREYSDACCGAGASALSVAEFVGPEGKVIGVDVAQALLELAQAKAAQRRLGNTQFELGDLLSLSGFQMKASMPQYACSEFSSFPIWPLECGNFGVAYDPVASWLSQRGDQTGSSRQTAHFGRQLRMCGLICTRASIRGTASATPASLMTIMKEGGVESVKIADENRLHPISSAEDWWAIVLGSGLPGNDRTVKPVGA